MIKPTEYYVDKGNEVIDLGELCVKGNDGVCNGNGICSTEGSCTCYTNDSNGHWSGENCNQCKNNYYPVSGDNDKKTDDSTNSNISLTSKTASRCQQCGFATVLHVAGWRRVPPSQL